jgi:hypothetical protein
MRRCARQADALDNAPQFATLAKLLREKDCAALRKHTMVCLARAWGYRCDIWHRRPRAGRGRPRAGPRPPKRKARSASPAPLHAPAACGAAAAPDDDDPHSLLDDADDALWADALGPCDDGALVQRAPPSPAVRWPTDPLAIALRGPAGSAMDALRGLVGGSLMPLARASACSWAGERALAASRGCARGLRAHRLEERLKDNTKCLQVMQSLRCWVSGQQAQLRSWRAQIAAGVPDAGAAAAWSLLRGVEGPMDAVLRMICAVVSAGEGDSRRLRADVLAHAPGASLAPAQLMWFAEVDVGIGDTLRWVAHAQVAGTPMRVASFHAYLEASDIIVGMVAQYVADAICAFQRRRLWMTEMEAPAAEVLSDAASARNCPGLHAAARELVALAGV